MARKWSRKRKQQQHRQEIQPTQGKVKDDAYDVQEQLKHEGSMEYHYQKFNAKMESYYAFQGLHSYRRVIADDDLEPPGTFAPCQSYQEMEEERKHWLSTLSQVLPASFRIARDQEKDLRERLEKQLNEFVGNEFDIAVSAVEGKGVNKITKSSAMKNSCVENDTNNSDKDDSTGDRQFDSIDLDHLQIEATASAVVNDDGGRTQDDLQCATDEMRTKKVAPVRKIPFVPNAYQLSIDRRTLRRNPSLEAFHQWLKQHSASGFLTRQETVSMIPPVVLAPKSHHAILDMCAAPGSKTGQLLEIVGEPICNGRSSQEPSGFVVANDADVKRAFMLVHQLRRLNSPAVFVTAEDAQRWPSLLRANNSTVEERALEGLFDRILCDVPCSGDGTARKNPGIWKFWSALGGLSLHPLQLSIALNGAKLAKVGGYMCYSTCSMNPIENEAVVSELLRLTDGSLELVDRRSDLQGLIARPGWTNWKVMSETKSRKIAKNLAKKNNSKMQERRREWEAKRKKMKDPCEVRSPNQEEKDGDIDIIDNGQPKDDDSVQGAMLSGNGRKPWVSEPPSWDEDCLLRRAEEAGLIWYRTYEDVPEECRRRVRKSCFPPTPEEIVKFNLHKCLRCLPHDMDTGGFFVALLKKVSPLSERAKKIADNLAEVLKQSDDDNVIESTLSQPVNNAMEDDLKMDDETSLIDNSCLKIRAVECVPAADGCHTVAVPTKNFGKEYFVKVPDDILPPLIEYYGLSDSFSRDQIFCRSCGDSKILYFITSAIKKALIDRGAQERVTVLTSGLRAFERGNKDSDGVSYRPLQEGIHYIAPYMTKRKLVAELDDFERCLAPGSIPLSKLSVDFANDIRTLSVGAFVVALKNFENNVGKKMFLSMWRCRGDNMNCLVNKNDMEGMKSKIHAVCKDDLLSFSA